MLARILTAVLAVCAVAAVGVPLAAQSSPAAQAARETAKRAAFFNTRCEFSHRRGDDPIVAPNRPGASHRHDFFGNRSTRAASTLTSLRRGGTTCVRRDDRAGYWVPTLRDQGRAVRPLRMNAYYRRARRSGTIRAFPAGLRVVAGDARAVAAQDTRVASWHCGPKSGVRMRSEPPACPPGTRLRMRVRFPECWDGRRLDSRDHRSHLAYARRARCPASHRVHVPRLVLNVVYPIADGRFATLASGGVLSGHADFFNAWNQRALETLVRRCLNASGNARRKPCTAGRRARSHRR